MKKILGMIAILVLISLLGIPFVNGIVMERTFKGAVDNMNKMYTDTGSDMRFEVESYNRGVFDTRVEWRIDFGSLAGVYGIEDMVFTETARHGFWQITSETRLEKNVWYADWVKHRLGGQDPLTIRTTYSATGPIVLKVTLDPIAVEAKNATLNIGALELENTVDQSFQSAAVTGTWQGISMDGANKMGPVVIHAAHNRITDLIWEGQGRVDVAAILTDENGSTVDLSNLSLDYDLTADPDHKKMDMAMGMKAEKIIFNGRPLSEWAVAISMENVDIPAYEAFAGLYYELINTHMAQIAGAGLTPDAAGQEFEKLMTRNAPNLVAGLEKLMKKDLELRISRLDLALPQGDISGRLSLGLKQDLTMAKCMMLAAQPDLALEIFSLESELSLPVVLAGPGYGSLTVPVFPGMKTGLFVQEGDALKHRAQIRDNRLYLNEQEVLLTF